MKILILVAVWALFFVSGFVVPRFIPPTGEMFTRGLNRLPAIIGLQCLAFGMAVVTAGLSFATRKELARWMLVTGFVPLAIEILLIVFVTVILVGAMAFGI